MRQGQQQNRRGRGRGGRKGQNPLSRSFESSGPDIKIRGTAQHIAEKYMALARDAIGSGDLVLGENYLQHAEHYNRIIMAAQTLPQGSFDQANGNGQRIARPEGDLPQVDGMGDGYDGDDDGEGDQPGANGGGFDQPRQFDSNGHRDQQRDHQQPRNRDQRDNNRNYEPRNYDNRNNDQRSYEPRGQGGQDQRGGYEPRYQEQPRVANNVDQPRVYEPPRQPQPDNRDSRPPTPDVRPAGEPTAPRGRRRRGRNENAPVRAYPPQVANVDSNGNGDAQPAHETHQQESNSEGGAGPGSDGLD